MVAKRIMLTAAAVLKMKPTDARQEIAEAGAKGLYFIIQPKPGGGKSWALRFRRPGGVPAKLTLGPLDLAGKEVAGDPQIGQPLSPAAARILAAQLNRQRVLGVDVAAARQSDKRSSKTASIGAGPFPSAARDFVDRHARPKTRRWRETARMLGLDFPLDGGEPSIVKGGLCARWKDKAVVAIDGDDIYTVVDEARYHGVPGLGRKNKGASDSRGRKMADVLGTLFGWLHEHRRIKVNPCIGTHRPPAPVARDRVLNVETGVRNADELRWLWRACNVVAEPFGAMCKLLLLTGCRREEIARMTRAELSDNLATLRLPGDRTKNGLPHDVPLPPLAREILRGVPQLAGCKFVFSTNGRTPISGFSKYKTRLDAAMLSEALKEQGRDATIPPWRLHDLRRTAATGMASIGVPPHIVEACLNHVSGAKAGVAGTYNRAAYEPEKRAALERWANHVTGTVSGRKAKVVPLRGRS
jgi:integrase